MQRAIQGYKNHNTENNPIYGKFWSQKSEALWEGEGDFPVDHLKVSNMAREIYILANFIPYFTIAFLTE